MRQLLHLRLDWRRQEARLERAILGAGMSLVAVIADVVLSRRLRR
jgi:type II secretory pathway component PulM